MGRVEGSVAGLQAGGDFAEQAAGAGPLGFDVGVDLEGGVQEVAILGVQLAFVDGHFAAIGGEFEAAHEVDHALLPEQDVEVGADLELKELLGLGLVIDHRGEQALDGLAAIDLHSETFREEHLSMSGEGDRQAE